MHAVGARLVGVPRKDLVLRERARAAGRLDRRVAAVRDPRGRLGAVRERVLAQRARLGVVEGAVGVQVVQVLGRVLAHAQVAHAHLLLRARALDVLLRRRRVALAHVVAAVAAAVVVLLVAERRVAAAAAARVAGGRRVVIRPRPTGAMVVVGAGAAVTRADGFAAVAAAAAAAAAR